MSERHHSTLGRAPLNVEMTWSLLRFMKESCFEAVRPVMGMNQWV